MKTKCNIKIKLAEITRIKVKEDYDPLVQIKKETDRVTQSISEKQINKTENIENNPLFENPFESNQTKAYNLSNKHIVVNLTSNESEDKSLPHSSRTIAKHINEAEDKSLPNSSRTIAKHNSDKTSNCTILNKNGLNNVQNHDDYEVELDKFKKYTKLKAETILSFEQASFKYFEEEFDGKIIMTDFRLIFIFTHKKFVQEDYFVIPLLMVIKLEKTIEKKNPGRYYIEITTKDNRTIKMCVIKDDQHKLYYNLNLFCNPKDIVQFYKFATKYKDLYPLDSNIGWDIYHPFEEYKRQGINFDDSVKLNAKNQKTNLKLIHNKNYQICETYPEFFILPKDFTDEDLSESKNFRTKNRIPVFCWMNKKSNATLWRSSQTKGGITQQRCVQDEKLLKLIGELGGDRLIIFDARPYLNALANRLKGAGFENTDNYYNTEIHFCEIDNIHCVRSSLNKLFTICKDQKINENRKFLSMLEQTQWYDFIQLLLKSSVEISEKLKKCNSVLIHCSDGWDRSTQLITLTELILDPFFRTIRGFIILIEKEWLSFGHQFAFRSGIYTKELSEDQRAPIFLQWLDCIHQLQYQYPNAFEFNGELLIFIAYHLNTCMYGTFLFNHEKDRIEKNVKNKTISIWSDVLENIHLYKNNFYSKDQIQELQPNSSHYKIRFWEEYFLRWNLSYITSLKKQHQGDLRKSFLKTNYFYENKKKEDSIQIDNQKKKLESYELVLREFCKLTINKNLFKDLSDEVKLNLSSVFDFEELELDSKASGEEMNTIHKETNNIENKDIGINDNS